MHYALGSSARRLVPTHKLSSPEDGLAVRGEAAADLLLNGFLVCAGSTTWHDGLKERSVGGVSSFERQEDSIVVDDPPGRCAFGVQSGSYALLFLSQYILEYG